MINDYQRKRKTRRLELQFLSRLSNPIPSMDLTTFLESLASLYYKTDLLNSLAIYLAAEANLEDILIAQRSAKSSFNLKEKNDFKLIRDVEMFYRLGFFHSMYPSIEIQSLKLLSDCFKDTNNILYNFELRTIYIRKLSELIKSLDRSNLFKNFEKIQSFAHDSNKITKIKSNISKTISSIINKYQKKFDTCLGERKELSELNKILMSKSKRELNSNQRRLLREYIDPFFETFNNNSFPLVFFNKGDNFELSALCHYHFEEKSFKNAFYFDIREVSHKSPTLVDIALAVSLSSPLFVAYLGILRARKDFWLAEKSKEEKEKLQKENLRQSKIDDQIETINEVIEDYSFAEKVFNEDLMESINSIRSDFYKGKLLLLSDLLIKQYTWLLNDFSFVISGTKLL